MASFLHVLRDITLLLIRLGLGGIMLLHGWTRWQGAGQGVQRQVDYLSQFSVPYPLYAAWGAIVLELVGGIFIIVGALTPLVALAFVVQQGLTIAYTNWYRGPDLLAADGAYVGGWEYNVALALLGLVLLAFGAGRISIDQLFRRKKPAASEDTDTDTGTTSYSSSGSTAF